MAILTNRYQYQIGTGHKVGQDDGNSAAPSVSALSAAATSLSATGYSTFTVGLDDRWKGGSARKSKQGNYGSETNRSLGSYPYRTEYVVYLESGTGGFTVGGTAQQLIGGFTMDATVTFFEHTKGHSFDTWLGYTNGYILGLANCGPTGQTGQYGYGPTGPGNSTDATAGDRGYSGGTGGRIFYMGDEAGVSWEVNTIETRIIPLQFRQACIELEISGSTLVEDVSALVYSETGATIDMTINEEHHSWTEDWHARFEYDKATTNHAIYGTTHANTVTGSTVYDTNFFAIGLNAITGGTPDNTSSQLHTLYHNWLNATSGRMYFMDSVHNAYACVGNTLDSVLKVRTFFESRNAIS